MIHPAWVVKTRKHAQIAPYILSKLQIAPLDISRAYFLRGLCIICGLLLKKERPCLLEI